MSDIIEQLTSQLGIGTDQAETGAGAILNLIKDKASEGDLKDLTSAVPEASSWMSKATGLATGDAGGGGLLGAAGGLLGGLGGGSAAGIAGIVGMLAKTGMSGETASKFLPLLLQLLKGKLGEGALTRIVSSVPALKDAMGGGGGLLGGVSKLFN